MSAKICQSLLLYRTVDGEHGRIETGSYWLATAPDFPLEKSAWQDLTSVGMVEARRELNEQTTTEVCYYPRSLPSRPTSLGAQSARIGGQGSQLLKCDSPEFIGVFLSF